MKKEKSNVKQQSVVIVENLSKEFKTGFRKNQGTLARFLEFFSGKKINRSFKVLDNISLELRKGEVLGIIGKNGCGKSTLLRVIAGIYKDYSGEIKVFGKLNPIIDLSAGMQSRLTMKDNVFLVGSLLGLSQKTIKENFNKIVEFSGLEDFVYAKLYQFSSGMKQRLAFSIAIHSNPEILLLDEVFSVGDENFKKKSSDKIHELVKKGCSIIFVSHDLKGVEKVCDRVIWLDKGEIKEQGKPKEVLREYLKKSS